MKLHYPVKTNQHEGMDLHGDNACKYLGFEKYNWQADRNEPAIFWLYFEDDFKYLAIHQGRKYIFWNGSDVLRTMTAIQRDPKFAANYLPLLREQSIRHACQNKQLQAELSLMGVHAEVRPMFYGDVTKYSRSSVLTRDCYMMANKGRGFEYGEGVMNALAWRLPEWNFHIFGIDPSVSVYCDNIKYYGWIPENEMDDITRDFALCFRYNSHDGFSQLIAKAILRGHIPVTTIDFGDMTLYCRNYTELVQAFAWPTNWKGLESVDGLINNLDWLA